MVVGLGMLQGFRSSSEIRLRSATAEVDWRRWEKGPDEDQEHPSRAAGHS